MKKGVLYTIVGKLREIPCIDLVAEEAKIAKGFPDGKIQLNRNHYRKEWYLEVRTQLTPAILPGLLARLPQAVPIMVIAEYITPTARKLLKQENIAYADAAGNIFLVDDEIYVYVENNTAERKETVTGSRAFTKTGLRVLFLLLRHPEYINETYRFIAEKAGAGLDTISKVFKALQKERYLISVTDKAFSLNKRKELLLHWVEGYQRNMKPKLHQKRYKTLEKDQDWKKLSLPEDTCWGGANAGALLTDYLIADQWTLYTGQDFITLMKAFRWVPDPEGHITLIEKFWHGEEQGPHVPPLIAYADLTEQDNPRYMETATIIYEEHLKDTL
ncbi:type IV toxin-antitoxin system AbiEi family antitoxin [Nafulsella turpanensis]|uniref:type IV toxin-antitoxin system AbiEi family antitoxin n=1 Tax=Nafulsella turpanensis TaxID=1265690 RepID=UPI00034DD25C|nr:type IV toxin-antitoxin system AbiEi family antitoxin [Nafulsella turpanensis]